MSRFKRVLAPPSSDLPDCRCGAEMPLIAVVTGPDGDSEVRIFRCTECNHELRLTIWHSATVSV
jgi:hypothetical protein